MCDGAASDAEEHDLGNRDARVLSDVHVGCSPEATSVCSVFFIFDRHETRSVDIDERTGDLDPPRKRSRHDRAADLNLTIQHAVVTSLEDVGLQVWRGALLLADYILSGACTELVRGHVALELGAGAGLVAPLLARAGARSVLATDVGDDVLDLCRRNVEKAAGPCGFAADTVSVLELDWYAPLPPDVPSGGVPQGGGSGGPAAAAGGGCRFQQWKGDSAALLRDVRVVFAADVIYDDDLTDAFMDCARRVFETAPQCEALFVAAERRINFSLTDLTARAHAFDHWRDTFDEEQGENARRPLPWEAEGARSLGGDPAGVPDAAAPSGTDGSDGNDGDCGEGAAVRRPFFVGRRLDAAAVPQAIFPCVRVPELELWCLWPRERKR